MSTQFPDASEFAALDALISGALEQSPETRGAWLRAQCRETPQRLSRALGLLQRCEMRPGWERALDSGALHAFVADAVDEGAIPERCGDWHLLQRIGRGGMAEVFLGERHAAGFVQRAAIKRLTASAHTQELVARFEQERRILAVLDDPRIARLLDGGVGADGRPWLAMEYVDGERIDAWCDGRRLDLAARVRLLRDVAAAVHSAHRALVVHRDIKPANVLVTAQGHVKLLDFGIAKLLDADPFDAAAAPTQTGTRALTPQYASPEQLLGHSVGTASDVYQLGLLLVELLAGVRPFQARAGNLVELSHAVVNEDAPSPSQALSRAGLAPDRLESIAQSRATRPRRLRSALRGDLDAIAQRALAREPDRRYASAQQLVDDLDAWLARRPVQACAPSLGYRLRRFVSRNWLASSVGAALVLVLVAYVGTTLVQSARIRREAELNRLVRDYLVELLRETDPLRTRDPDPSAERVLEQGLIRARERFTEQPDLLAEVLGIGAEVQIGRGDYARAAALIGEAIALRRGLDPTDPQLTDAMAQHGRTLHYTARYREAEAVLRDAQARWYAQQPTGSPWIPLSLADVLHSRGEYVEAAAVLRRAQTATSWAPGRSEVARDLGSVLRDSGRIGEARALHETALSDMRRELGEAHGNTAATRAALARTYLLSGDAAAAREMASSALSTQREYFGEHHAVIGIGRHILALADEIDGDFGAAERALDEVLSQDYAQLAAANVLLAYAHLDRAWLRLQRGRDAEASADLDVAEPTLRDIRTGGHPRWAELHLARAILALRRGHHDEARAAIGRAVRQRAALFGDDSAMALGTRRWYALLGEAPAATTPALLPLEALRLQRLGTL